MVLKTIFRVAIGGALAVAGAAALAHGIIRHDLPFVHR